MPQGPIGTAPATTPGGSAAPEKLDVAGLLLTTRGGKSSLLNATAAVAVKATPGRIAKLIIIDPGTTGGAFTINDCATTGAAAAANTIWSAPYNGTGIVKGAVIDLDFPCAVGITLSAVPSGGTPIVAISYT